MSLRRRLITVVAACGLLALAIVLWAPTVRSTPISLARAFDTALPWAENVDAQIFFVARLPRVLAGALIGAPLAAAGVVLQALLRNPLKGKEPDDDIIRIERITKVFQNARTVVAVDDVSFTVRRGEIFGLLGPNVAGKSTTINMIAGVTRLGGGRIEVFGFDNCRDYRTTRRLVGVMHHEVVIDNFFTIDQTLKFHAGYYGVRDDPAWRQRLIERLGLGPHLHKVMIKLSGGLKRRFMIAKAMLHKPRLLILDEH